MDRRFPARLACLLGLLCAAPAGADDFDPLPALDLHPLTQIHGLPPGGGARLLAPGRAQVQLRLQAASHFLRQRSGQETLVLDGETHRLSLVLRARSAGAEWGIEIPYLTHGGGFLDGFIESWHDAFGLPQGGRDEAPRGRLEFFYSREGETRVHVERAPGGIGDIRLLAAWPLTTGSSLETSLRASLELPTGEPRFLQGSGAADLALWWNAVCGACAGSLGWHTAAGVLVLGRGEVLPELQRTLAAFGSVGAGWRTLPGLVLKAELRAHTPFYRDSRVRALDRSAVQLLLGGSWAVRASTTLDVAVTEDVRVETAPDVGLLLSLRAAF